MAGEHAGHRQRIIGKLESGTLLDHELLEVLLFSLQPRKNTNDLAHRLLAHFGTIQAVFSASMEELKKVKGVGDSIAANLRCIGIVYRKHFLNDEAVFKGKFDTHKFISFAGYLYEDIPYEVIDMYILTVGGEITKRYRFTDECGTSVKVDAVELSAILAEEKPMGIVLAHNHPYGNSLPSKADDEITKICHITCGLHGILLCDHIIYSPKGSYSYYLGGRLQQIQESYTITDIKQ